MEITGVNTGIKHLAFYCHQHYIIHFSLFIVMFLIFSTVQVFHLLTNFFGKLSPVGHISGVSCGQ